MKGDQRQYCEAKKDVKKGVAMAMDKASRESVDKI